MYVKVLRPDFEVVKEGRILKKIKHIQILIGRVLRPFVKILTKVGVGRHHTF
jgi:hypothetical protein